MRIYKHGGKKEEIIMKLKETYEIPLLVKYL